MFLSPIFLILFGKFYLICSILKNEVGMMAQVFSSTIFGRLRGRQIFCEFEASLIYNEFQDSQNYLVGPCLRGVELGRRKREKENLF